MATTRRRARLLALSAAAQSTELLPLENAEQRRQYDGMEGNEDIPGRPSYVCEYYDEMDSQCPAVAVSSADKQRSLPIPTSADSHNVHHTRAIPVTKAMLSCGGGSGGSGGLPDGDAVVRKVHEVLCRLQSMECMNSANAGELKAVGASMDACMTTTRQVVSEEMSRARTDLSAIRTSVDAIQKHVRSIDERNCMYRQQMREELQRIRQLVQMEANATRANTEQVVKMMLQEVVTAVRPAASPRGSKEMAEAGQNEDEVPGSESREASTAMVNMHCASEVNSGHVDSTLSMLVNHIQSMSQQMLSMSMSVKSLHKQQQQNGRNECPRSCATAGDGLKQVGTKENTADAASNVAGCCAAKRKSMEVPESTESDMPLMTYRKKPRTSQTSSSAARSLGLDISPGAGAAGTRRGSVLDTRVHRCPTLKAKRFNHVG